MQEIAGPALEPTTVPSHQSDSSELFHPDDGDDRKILAICRNLQVCTRSRARVRPFDPAQGRSLSLVEWVRLVPTTATKIGGQERCRDSLTASPRVTILTTLTERMFHVSESNGSCSGDERHAYKRKPTDSTRIAWFGVLRAVQDFNVQERATSSGDSHIGQ